MASGEYIGVKSHTIYAKGRYLRYVKGETDSMAAPKSFHYFSIYFQHQMEQRGAIAKGGGRQWCNAFWRRRRIHGLKRYLCAPPWSLAGPAALMWHSINDEIVNSFLRTVLCLSKALVFLLKKMSLSYSQMKFITLTETSSVRNGTHLVTGLI